MDKLANVLSLSGYVAGTIHAPEPYNENIFGDTLLGSEGGRRQLRTTWKRILAMLGDGGIQTRPPASTLTAATSSFPLV